MAEIGFQNYDNKNNRLFLHLSTDTTIGDILLRVENKVYPLKKAKLVDSSILSVRAPCEWLTSGGEVYWATGYSLEHASVPAQTCWTSHKESVKINLDSFGTCWIQVGNNTLWRAANEMKKVNAATVYQNIYAIFLDNKMAFIDNDINKLNSTVLFCPSKEAISAISPTEAYDRFRIMLDLNAEE